MSTGGCIFFDRARDIWMWIDVNPGDPSPEGEVRDILVTLSGFPPGEKLLTEIASEMSRPCLTFAKKKGILVVG